MAQEIITTWNDASEMATAFILAGTMLHNLIPEEDWGTSPVRGFLQLAELSQPLAPDKSHSLGIAMWLEGQDGIRLEFPLRLVADVHIQVQ